MLRCPQGVTAHIKHISQFYRSLSQVEREIESMEGNISQLKAAIEEKLAPLKVAHTRLAQRSQRPNIELTRDPAQYQLVNEVKLIESAIAVSL